MSKAIRGTSALMFCCPDQMSNGPDTGGNNILNEDIPGAPDVLKCGAEREGKICQRADQKVRSRTVLKV